VAKYQREYRETKDRQQFAQGFARGVAETRNYLMKNFAVYDARIQKFSGPEFAGIIERVPGPQLPAEE
jgi:hypothetical protein